MSLARDLMHDVRAVNRHLGRLRFLLETANIFPDEREIIMAAIDDLTTAVGNLETASAAAVAEIGTLTSSENETALEALATRINTVTSNLTAAVPPAPTPTPAPAS
jgi:predicted RecB family endonuclease